MGITITESKATLDQRFPVSGATDYIGFSTDGSSETTMFPNRLNVGATGWSAATSADPSIKTNAADITSASCTASGTCTHFAIFTHETVGSGYQRTDWQGLGQSKTLAVGDKLQFASGALKISLT